MAKKPSLGYGLSRAATIAGWCYLPFYLFLLSYLIQYVAALLGLHPSMLTVNLIYFAVNLAVVLIIFHDFLRQRFFGPGFSTTPRRGPCASRWTSSRRGIPSIIMRRWASLSWPTGGPCRS